MISPDLAKELQKDSSFAEVLAINAAARRAKGEYIARIDQDTVVAKAFLEKFFRLYEDKTIFGIPLDSVFMFAVRKHLPFKFVKNYPSIRDIDFVIRYEGRFIRREEIRPFWYSGVGIIVMHRDIWEGAGGYDERLIYYWAMDADLVIRAKKKYHLINIGKKMGYDFYHLEHFSTHIRASHRRLNPSWAYSDYNKVLNPNGSNWGLPNCNLENLPAHLNKLDSHESSTLQKEYTKSFYTKLFFKASLFILEDWIRYFFRSLLELLKSFWIRLSSFVYEIIFNKSPYR